MEYIWIYFKTDVQNYYGTLILKYRNLKARVKNISHFRKTENILKI